MVNYKTHEIKVLGNSHWVYTGNGYSSFCQAFEEGRVDSYNQIRVNGMLYLIKEKDTAVRLNKEKAKPLSLEKVINDQKWRVDKSSLTRGIAFPMFGI